MLCWYGIARGHLEGGLVCVLSVQRHAKGPGASHQPCFYCDSQLLYDTSSDVGLTVV